MKLKLRAWHWLLAYGLSIYLLFLLVNLPASVVWSFAPQNIQNSVTITNLQGTAWSASADNIVLNGFELGKTKWTLNPFLLFIGKLGGNINVRNALGQADSGFKIDSEQMIELSDLDSEFSAAIFDPAVRPFMLTGSINSQLEAVQIQGKVLFAATGTLQWRNAAITGVQDVSLGNLLFKASPEAKGTRLQVTNEGGVIAVNGDIRLTGNGRYNLNLLLSSRDNRNTDLKNMLAVLGRADAQGRVRFTQAGRLPGW
jgi:hypothetical protein